VLWNSFCLYGQHSINFIVAHENEAASFVDAETSAVAARTVRQRHFKESELFNVPFTELYTNSNTLLSF